MAGFNEQALDAELDQTFAELDASGYFERLDKKYARLSGQPVSASARRVPAVKPVMSSAGGAEGVSPLRSAGRCGIILSSPNSDGYGGGTRDNTFAEKLGVFAGSVAEQITDSYMGEVIGSVSGYDKRSFKASVVAVLSGKRFGILDLKCEIGKGCSDTFFGEPVGRFSAKDLSSTLVDTTIGKLLEEIKNGKGEG